MQPVLIGAGANIAGPAGPPAATLAQARMLLAQAGVRIDARSRTYASLPWGGVRQPAFVNEVWRVRSPCSPVRLLGLLLDIERTLGRRRRVRWGPRTIDLDLLGVGQLEGEWPGPPALMLPHPQLAMRAFVLRPLADVAPRWRPPGHGGLTVEALLTRLGPATRGSAVPMQ